jgi:peptidyl-prolyl cis-trans isomerase B (cyclophilin B)
LKKFLGIIFLTLFLITLGNQSFAQSDDKLVILHTNLGKIVIEFFPNDAPKHVENFIKLAESGFYDGTIFHRIIPGFMIQGGDPNTKSGDPTTWGIGGPNYSVNAEFNTIKHNRGIVSMARSADPNSAGSQFFIVHKDSNFLDEQYTVFGRIVTQESFDTLDKIASVQTGDRDIPVNIEQVKITKAEVVKRSDVSNLLNLSEPERTTTEITSSSGSQLYENKALDISFNVPTGWLLQEPEKTDENAPDIVAVGPRVGTINPVISLTVSDSKGRSLDDLIKEKDEFLKNALKTGNLEIISQEKSTINKKQAYVTNAKGFFSNNGTSYNVQFRETIISTPEKFYIFAYSNGIENFNDQISRFEDSVTSFKITSEPIKETKSDTASVNSEVKNEQYDDFGSKGGGCLIATATYGSELAPQVQQLRELRDNSLLKTESGTSFMSTFNQFYYSFSPTIADWERENPVFKEAVKITLTPMISSLSILNNVDMDSEAKVLGYGISLIILNVGMYFVAPAMLFYGIKKKKHD